VNCESSQSQRKQEADKTGLGFRLPALECAIGLRGLPNRRQPKFNSLRDLRLRWLALEDDFRTLDWSQIAGEVAAFSELFARHSGSIPQRMGTVGSCCEVTIDG